jgi:hypothetical protein
MKKFGLLLLLMVVAVMLGGTALAQDTDSYFTTYYSGNIPTAGATTPDGTVRVINDGFAGNLYANFFVLDDSEELTQCCSCEVTPDGLLSESVHFNLTTNPIRGILNTRGVIKVIAGSAFGPPAVPFNTTAINPPIVVSAGLHVWATHVQGTKVTLSAGLPVTPVVAGPWFVTETLAADSNLVMGEQTILQDMCYFDFLLSGKPCTCQPEDYDF